MRGGCPEQRTADGVYSVTEARTLGHPKMADTKEGDAGRVLWASISDVYATSWGQASGVL